MSFGDAVKTVFRKYATFTGRASRAEYWWWQLFFAITFGSVYLIAISFIAAYSSSGSTAESVLGGFFSVIAALWALALVLPNLAVLVRRIRDAGFSPYFVFLGLIPYAGGIVLFVFSVMPSRDRPGTPGLAPVATIHMAAPTATSASSAKFCASCGSPVAGQAFCASCGTQVGS